MQDGVLSAEEWNTLNSRVINGNEVQKPNPLKSKYAAYYNMKSNVELLVGSSCRDEDVCVNHVLVHCECLVGLSQ